MKVILAEERERESGPESGSEVAPRAEPDSDAAPVDLDSRRLSRFLEEAQITGQLDHPGIVPVHELGLDDRGRVYFTMRSCAGATCGRSSSWSSAQRRAGTRTRALGVILKVCEAMAYAHAKGVIHRDLKPANIMVGRFGEVYVMDWGLARVLGARGPPRPAAARARRVAEPGAHRARRRRAPRPARP